MREIRWAWRNITARRGRAALTIGLLAVALAATTIVFSAADSLVFRRVAYPAADRLVTFDTRDAVTGGPGGGFASAAVLDTHSPRPTIENIRAHYAGRASITDTGDAVGVIPVRRKPEASKIARN